MKLTPAAKFWGGYFAALLIAAVATMTACQPARADQNVVCAQFVRVGMKIADPVAYTIRSSSPYVVKRISHTDKLIPPDLQFLYGKTYNDAMVVYCSNFPNNGSWEASEYAIKQANIAIFKTAF